MTSVRIELAPPAVEALSRPVNGSGGFQSLLREIQRRLDDRTILVLDAALVERIARYVEQSGEGGFQGRLEYVLDELRGLAAALRPMLK
jgi:hypothetical protein